MKKTIFLKIYYFIALILVVVECFFIVKSTTAVDINDLPKGDFQFENVSPNGEIKLKVYKLENSICSSVRVAAEIEGETSNVYWQTHEENMDVLWLNDSEVLINGVLLNVQEGGSYDCRSGLSIFTEGSVNISEDK